MSDALDDEALKASATILSVVAVADSNFPAATNVSITALGANSASITIPSYVLARIVDAGRASLKDHRT